MTDGKPNPCDFIGQVIAWNDPDKPLLMGMCEGVNHARRTFIVRHYKGWTEEWAQKFARPATFAEVGHYNRLSQLYGASADNHLAQQTFSVEVLAERDLAKVGETGPELFPPQRASTFRSQLRRLRPLAFGAGCALVLAFAGLTVTDWRWWASLLALIFLRDLAAPSNTVTFTDTYRAPVDPRTRVLAAKS